MREYLVYSMCDEYELECNKCVVIQERYMTQPSCTGVSNRNLGFIIMVSVFLSVQFHF